MADLCKQNNKCADVVNDYREPQRKLMEVNKMEKKDNLNSIITAEQGAKLIKQIKAMEVYTVNKEGVKDFKKDDYISWFYYEIDPQLFDANVKIIFEDSCVNGDSEREFYLVDADFNARPCTTKEDDILRDYDDEEILREHKDEICLCSISKEVKPSVDAVTFEKNKAESVKEARKFWSDVAKKVGWYKEPFYVQVWVYPDGSISDSISTLGLTEDVVVLEGFEDEE